MKQLLPILILCLALSPKEQQFKNESGKPMFVVPPIILVTNTLRLSWDYPADIAGIDGVNIYAATNEVDWKCLGVVRLDDQNPTNFTMTFIDQKRYRTRYFMARSFSGSLESVDSNIARYPKWPDIIVGMILRWTFSDQVVIENSLNLSTWFPIGNTNGTSYLVPMRGSIEFFRLNGTQQPLSISPVMADNPRNK